MALRAGFAEIDITPPFGIQKIGWLEEFIADQLADPLFARLAVFDNGETVIGFIQLDVLSVRWTQVQDIRQRIERAYGISGAHIMISASHNHAGPATSSLGFAARDEQYIETLTQQCVATFGQALDNRQQAEIGAGHTYEWDVAHNRRVVMRDGTVRTHGVFSNPDALYFEGPIDPEVAVLAVRSVNGAWLGCLVNFSCHPTHHGGDTVLSAGYPGVLAREMRAWGMPVTLFLNGACGNTHTANPITGSDDGMEAAGKRLACDAQQVLAEMQFTSEVSLAARTQTISLPYRAATEEEVRGTIHGAQRFAGPEYYDAGMPALVERINTRGTQPAEVQVLVINDWHFAGIPAEYFVEHGLRMKTESHPHRALVVSHANGMVGYVPTQAAFTRGGYETTFSGVSKLAPEAGELLTDTAIELIMNRVRV